MTLILQDLKVITVHLVVLSAMMTLLPEPLANILTVTSVTASSIHLFRCITTIQLEHVTVTSTPAFG